MTSSLIELTYLYLSIYLYYIPQKGSNMTRHKHMHPYTCTYPLAPLRRKDQSPHPHFMGVVHSVWVHCAGLKDKVRLGILLCSLLASTVVARSLQIIPVPFLILSASCHTLVYHTHYTRETSAITHIIFPLIQKYYTCTQSRTWLAGFNNSLFNEICGGWLLVVQPLCGSPSLQLQQLGSICVQVMQMEMKRIYEPQYPRGMCSCSVISVGGASGSVC